MLTLDETRKIDDWDFEGFCIEFGRIIFYVYAE